MSAERWMPEELNKAYATVQEEMRVEEILAAFQFRMDPVPAQNAPGADRGFEAPDIFQKEASQFAQSKSTVRYAAWEPDELVWMPPLTGLDEDAGLFCGGGESLQTEEHQAAPQNEQERAEDEAGLILAQARQQAEELLVQAQLTADETLREAQEEAEQTLQAAMGEGYRQGWAKAEEDAASALKAAGEVVRQFTQWREGMFAQSEAIVLELVRQTARAMFGDGIHLDAQALEANLNRVLENAKSLGDLRVYLHPGDAEKLDPAWREYQQLITGNRVQVIPSDGIKPGGCFVQGQMGTVDARVETQLRAVMDVFVDADNGESGS